MENNEATVPSSESVLVSNSFQTLPEHLNYNGPFLIRYFMDDNKKITEMIEIAYSLSLIILFCCGPFMF